MAVIGSATAAPLDSGNERVIHASGSGTVIGTPDRSQVSLAIEIENPNVKIAWQENAARMTQVIDRLVIAGFQKTPSGQQGTIFTRSMMTPRRRLTRRSARTA